MLRLASEAPKDPIRMFRFKTPRFLCVSMFGLADGGLGILRRWAQGDGEAR